MHYSYSVPVSIAGPAFPSAAIGVLQHEIPGRRAEADRRWPALLRTLTSLRERGRRSIRIVDTSCGAGDLLSHAGRRARSLGFVAIEGRGIDRDPLLIARARVEARAAADPAIGLDFATGDPRAALDEEAAFPADIVLYAGGDEALRSA